jgi:tetratricopeptide (TPR) repeat protein
MEWIENFLDESAKEIQKVEYFRNKSDFSKAFDLIEFLEKEICEHISEDYQGQVLVGPIGSFTVLDIELQILISRLVYEKGKTESDVGAIKEAKECHLRALEMRKETFKLGTESMGRILDVAYSAFELARAELRLRDRIGPTALMKETEEWIRKAIEVSKSDIFHLGKMYHNLGYVLHAQDRVSEAISVYEKALDIQDTSGDEKGYDLTSVRISECYFSIALGYALHGIGGSYERGDKPRVGEGKEKIRSICDLCERFFREHEVTSLADDGRWKIKSVTAATSDLVHYDPHKCVVELLEFLVEDMKVAGERFIGESPMPVLSLMPYKFLDGQVENGYIQLQEFLNRYHDSNTIIREEMGTGRVSQWISKILVRLGEVKPDEFKNNDQDREEFVKKAKRHIYEALWTSWILAKMDYQTETQRKEEEQKKQKKQSQSLNEWVQSDRIIKGETERSWGRNQLWIDYILDSSFLDELEKIALCAVERYSDNKEEDEKDVRETFDLTNDERWKEFPEIVEKQKNRKTQ